MYNIIGIICKLRQKTHNQQNKHTVHKHTNKQTTLPSNPHS